MYPGRLDDKGRLKVAAPFQKYYESLEEKTLLVTSLDRRTAVIYTLSDWRAMEMFLASSKALSKQAEVILWNANKLGSEVEMDGQGRILFNSELRRAVGLEGTGLQLYKVNSHVEVVPESFDKEMERRAVVEGPAALLALKEAGLP